MVMSKERREKVAEEKTRLIREAALELFDMKGYRETTIGEIAEKAGISKGLVYKYFDSKKDILRSFEASVAKCSAELAGQETPLESLRLSARRVLLRYEDTGYHAPLRILIKCYALGDISDDDIPAIYDFKNYGRSDLGQFFRKGQEEGLFREGDPEIMGDIFWHVIMGYAIHMVQGKESNVTDETIDMMLKMFSV